MPLSIEDTARGHAASDAKATVVRPGHLADTVAVVDGLGGCGKTLVTAIVGSLDRVELMKYNYHLEHVCILRHLHALDGPTAAALVRTFTDLDLYHLMMAREANFRPSDLSGVTMNARPWRYLLRLFQPEGEAAVERIKRQRPILHLVTHHLLGVSQALFEGLGDRLRFIEVVRHPLYMVKQWHACTPRMETDPRVFSVRVEYAGRSLPWFARGWEGLYLSSNDMDRTIYAMDQEWRLAQRTHQALSEAHKRQVMVIPFERFVLDPQPFMRALETLLGASAGWATRRMMRRQRVPRRRYAEGIGLPIYKRYGWEPPRGAATEAEEFERRRRFAAERASPEAMAVLDRLSTDYEATYLQERRT